MSDSGLNDKIQANNERFAVEFYSIPDSYSGPDYPYWAAGPLIGAAPVLGRRCESGTVITVEDVQPTNSPLVRTFGMKRKGDCHA